MEGAHGDLPTRLPHETQDPLPHLVGGLVGERDREDLPRPHALDAHQVGDAVREHPRLARSGAGQDEQRPLGGGDRACLLRVEPADDTLRERLRAEQRLPAAPRPVVPDLPVRRSPRPRTRPPPPRPPVPGRPPRPCACVIAWNSRAGRPAPRAAPRRPRPRIGSGGGGSSGQSKESWWGSVTDRC